jgi:hypothetical protein
MKIKDILTSNYRLMTDEQTLNRVFKGCYQSDLLSRVIKNAEPDDILITIINHINTIATATMVDLSCVIICEDQKPTEMMMKRANEEMIAILITPLKSYEVVIDLFQRGLI